MSGSANVAIRKRQEIARANRTMFIWVAGASAILGIAAALSITLINKLTFNQAVITKQASVVSILENNEKNAQQLLDNARVLNTDQSLRDSRADPENDTALQVILEALPSVQNRAALGSSLQERLLKIDGVTIDSLSVEDSIQNTGTSATASSPIGFTFVARAADPNKLFDLLKQLESSIRPIKVLSLSLETGRTDTTLSVTAESYYQPAVSIDLGETTLKPGARIK